ncbi:MotA/TolQ/ExbB proton channel family protein [Halopseudomonas salegens]|uniref:Outer membrane transport energization protein ExbB n=1 Tax=Halopseudomonas salegens TaxID=1434072 RepID=A0A1H2EGV9_9GAMM|nr:MotA/TolQ/ExbB proton channel family protein [Halopseudomonas salegens]SDT94284.1 outer membrane transport energization protein ExbB [Halopseudomonas salegens]
MRIAKHKSLTLSLVLIVGLVSSLALADSPDLDRLLQDMRELRSTEQQAMQAREQAFIAERGQQQARVQRAEAELAELEAEAEALRQAFDELDAALTAGEEELTQRSGNLGELFGVVRQSAGDTRSQWQDSLLNVRFPQRLEILEQLAESRRVPTAESLEDFWLLLQEDMTASARIARFNAPVVGLDGQQQEAEVVHVGPFMALRDGQYLSYTAEAGQFEVPQRQPAGRGLIDDFVAPRNDVADLWVDVTRGNLLNQLQRTPSLLDRVQQGGLVGYVIVFLGVLGVLLALGRLVWLQRIQQKVNRQIADLDHLRSDNPLGRVLGVIGSHPRLEQLDTLELKLDEAILKETPALERWQGLIKLLAAVAPLLGLLGTVTGMIATFQAITLFGTGDPQLMAGGISQALVTTVLGLIAAIPLLFMHALVAARSKSLVQLLEQQSAGLIALHLGEERPRE